MQGVFIPFSLECRFFLLFCEKSDIYGFFLGIFAIFLLVFIFSYIIILKLGSLLYGFSLYTTNFTEPLSYQDSAFLKLPKFP
ncbi:hypothetical protein ECD89_05415 [Acinetobacter baumannii]|nr:hypothetical protein [Acinetobacter baumannii]